MLEKLTPFTSFRVAADYSKSSLLLIVLLIFSPLILAIAVCTPIAV